MKLRASNPVATRIARKDANKAGFPMTGIDILGEGVGNGGDHLAAIMIWGQTEADAKQRQAFIVRAVNNFDGLISFLINARAHALSGDKDETYAELRGDFLTNLLHEATGRRV